DRVRMTDVMLARASGSNLTQRGQATTGSSYLVDRTSAVAGREIHRPDRIREHDDLEASAERVEDGRPNAVVGGEAADVEPTDTALLQDRGKPPARGVLG